MTLLERIRLLFKRGTWVSDGNCHLYVKTLGSKVYVLKEVNSQRGR